MGLMILLIPVIMAGNLLPQTGRVSPAAIQEWQQAHPLVGKAVLVGGFHHVYTSWWFLCIFSCLFLNMALVTWDLARTTLVKARGLHRYSHEAVSYFTLDETAFSRERLDRFEAVLRGRGYVLKQGTDEIYGRKGWLGIWGGTILHLGLVVLLVGALISGLSRFNGYMELGAGQEVPENDQAYAQKNKGIFFPGHLQDVTLRLDGTEEHRNGKMNIVTSAVAVMDHKSGEEVHKTLTMNDPLYFHGLKMYQSDFVGPAALFVVTSPGAPESVAGYVNLQSRNGSNAIFSLPGTPFQAKIDYHAADRSLEMEVHDRNEVVYKGPIAIGQTLKADDFLIRLEAVNKWTGLLVVYDRAVPVIFTGFILAILGIAVMGLFDPREIWARRVSRDGTDILEIVGWGRWRNMFLDEFHDMKEKLG